MAETPTADACREEATDEDAKWMRRAIELAYRGEGHVEPNPMVGCVVVKEHRLVAEGFHAVFGGPHAEVSALSSVDLAVVEGGTIYVTLEPCTHFGKTPPCVDLLLRCKPRRVVIGTIDPFPPVSGKGIARLQSAGIDVVVGAEEKRCRRLIAPFVKRTTTGLPWVIAKWAMTLDGRIAAHTGDSKWVTGEPARQHAQGIRGRVDAIAVGIGTAIADDPLLTARPTGPRQAARIVFDSHAKLPLTSQLVRTARDYPTVVVSGPMATRDSIRGLEASGCEVIVHVAMEREVRSEALLRELASRGHTNLLIDGGPHLQGFFFDQGWIDEVHVYVAPKMIGGPATWAPNIGAGLGVMNQARAFDEVHFQPVGDDLWIQARFSQSS